MHRLSWLAFVLSIGAWLPAPREVRPTDWPVERLVRNLTARLAADPEDAEACYTLGRVHAFAFALERSTLLGGGNESTVWVKDLEAQREHASSGPAPTPEERREHLTEGLRHLRRACELADTPLHRLTLAWLLETGAPLAAEVDTPALFGLAAPGDAAERAELEGRIAALGAESTADAARRFLVEPANLARAVPLLASHAASADTRLAAAARELLQRWWTERAIDAYRRCLELVEESGLFEDPMLQGPVGRQVPREALEAYRRLVRARGARDAEEERRLAEADARWKTLEENPGRDWVTPILLTLEAGDCPSLADLTRPEARVPFDLDGDGVDELWPWLAPDAGWLVWDPSETGAILSGRQLFGSASAWLFFEHGYRVLDALDDDRDGALRGAELAGLAVWFDRDSDGISDRGEVVSVERLGIVGLATDATVRLGASLANPCGVELADGRVLPTYDWVLAPAATP